MNSHQKVLHSMAVRASRMQWATAIGIVVACFVLSYLPVQSALPGEAGSTAAGEPLQVTLLQGNIPQNEKFQSGTGVATALNWYGQQLRDAKTPLVVAPETCLLYTSPSPRD